MFRRSFPYALPLVACAATMLLASAPAAAQSTEGTKPAVSHQQIVSANPFGLMLGWWNVEFERKRLGGAHGALRIPYAVLDTVRQDTSAPTCPP